MIGKSNQTDAPTGKSNVSMKSQMNLSTRGNAMRLNRFTIVRNLQIVLCLCFSILPMLADFGHCDGPRPKTIRVATPEWKDLTNADGTGAYFDLLRTIYEPLGVRVDYKIVPFKRAEFTVSAGEADVLPGCYHDPQYESVTYYPRYPISGEEMAAFFKKTTVGEWKGQESMADKRVLSLRGYDMDTFLDIPVTYWEIDRTSQGVKLITVGRHDFYIDDRVAPEKAVADLDIDMSGYRIETVMQRYSFLCFGMTEKSKSLIKIYDERLPALMEEGVVGKIWEKYGFPMIELKRRDGGYGWER